MAPASTSRPARMVTRLAARMPCANCCSSVSTWAMASFTRTVEMLGNLSVTARYMRVLPGRAPPAPWRGRNAAPCRSCPGDSTSTKFCRRCVKSTLRRLAMRPCDLAAQHVQGHGVADLQSGALGDLLVERDQGGAGIIGRPPFAVGDHGAGRRGRGIGDAAVAVTAPISTSLSTLRLARRARRSAK